MGLIQMMMLYLLLINGIAFFLMWLDKRRARHKEWRIPEKTLFLPVCLGGAVGGILGMYAFRHKTKHWYFRYGFPLIGVIEAIVFLVMIVKFA